MDREEGVVIREDAERWFEIEAVELPIGPQGPGWFIAWFALSQLFAEKRTGAGRRYYEWWENQLPNNVRFLYLLSLEKPRQFWKAMGFHPVYHPRDPAVPDEARFLLVKDLTGAQIKCAPYFEEEYDEIADFYAEEVSYRPDIAELKKVALTYKQGVYVRSISKLIKKVNILQRSQIVAMALPENIYGATVYHGSNKPDLEWIKGNYPHYEGSIGGGVYVDADYNVASYYGQYIYELKLLIHPEEVFVLEPNFIQELAGYSMIIGEQVDPFWFVINGDRYAVVGGYDDDEKLLDHGTSIDLDEIGTEVEAHGYKAIYLEGIRPMSELLIFDSNNLEMVGLVENKD